MIKEENEILLDCLKKLPIELFTIIIETIVNDGLAEIKSKIYKTKQAIKDNINKKERLNKLIKNTSKKGIGVKKWAKNSTSNLSELTCRIENEKKILKSFINHPNIILYFSLKKLIKFNNKSLSNDVIEVTEIKNNFG